MRSPRAVIELYCFGTVIEVSAFTLAGRLFFNPTIGEEETEWNCGDSSPGFAERNERALSFDDSDSWAVAVEGGEQEETTVEKDNGLARKRPAKQKNASVSPIGAASSHRPLLRLGGGAGAGTPGSVVAIRL